MAIPSSGEREPITFFSLPQELRDQIYGYYFNDTNEDIEIDLRHPHEIERETLISFSPLVVASKQLHAKTFEQWYRARAATFWATHTFLFKIDVKQPYQPQFDALASFCREQVPGMINAAFEVVGFGGEEGLKYRTDTKLVWKNNVLGIFGGVYADCGRILLHKERFVSYGCWWGRLRRADDVRPSQ